MPDPITPAVTAAVAAEAATHLGHLQEALQSFGLHARLLTQDDRLPRLRVINPEATTLTETISVAPRDGHWLFSWSWNAPITDVAQLTTAAERIRHVLATTPQTPHIPAQRDTADAPGRRPDVHRPAPR